MTQEQIQASASGWRTLARVLAATAFVSVPLGIPAATASTYTVSTPSEVTAATAAQSGPDRTAPCRRWQNPNAYGHWHCR
ncbi:hypothetical protein ACFTSD_18560 [Nocardiaceae bacterium NPDC056970]